MKIKMLIYPEEVSFTCELMWPDMEALYNLNHSSTQSEHTNDTGVICILSLEFVLSKFHLSTELCPQVLVSESDASIMYLEGFSLLTLEFVSQNLFRSVAMSSASTCS